MGPERGGPAPADGAPAGSAPPRRWTGAAIAAAAVVIVAVLMTGFLLLRGDDSGQVPVAATTVQDSVAAENPAPTTASDPGSDTDDTTQGSSSAAAESPSTESPSTEPTATELAAAVSGYYALMPGNTDAGWALLTPSFQSGIAQNRDYYDSFWSGVAQVGVSDVTGTPPGTVEATVTYTFTDGSVSVERTAYQLVDDGGTLKIDSSSVLSSRAG